MSTSLDNSILTVILGGGKGTRLYPLTKLRAKPAVPLAGRYRLIDVPVSTSINSGITRIFVLTQYNSASLNRHLARAYQFDRFSNGFVSILAAEQTPSSKDWFQGTADAVRRSLPHIEGHRHRHVLILSGDQLYSMDYRKMLAHHRETDADVTLGTIPVAADDATSFGILKTDDEHIITEFHEKPDRDALEGLESPVGPGLEDEGRVYHASMGMYIFDREPLRELLNANPNDHDFGNQIIPKAIDKMRVASYPFSDYWSDIGTIRSFYEANLMLAEPEPPFSLYDPNRPLYTRARMLPPAKVQNSTVQDSLITEGSLVENSQISKSVVGIRSYVGPDTTLKNTVMMGADHFRWHDMEERGFVEGPANPGIGENSYVEGAIIDKNVSIGKRCIIKNRDNVQEAEEDLYHIRDGIVVIPKNTRIPDDTII
ncbi:glucose-1-phosphate adenylyltransferase [Salinibacter ruber]|uniref:glucose-1-phosphate adenylyltransferase n=1 Tax=Salinibacter ruber TaxID=146919 RepID=UPI0021673DC5|nr:glucose-1-phosphate adenylyltransferase [Salinibacter ruber]MCS3648888.1 glucose-1-phosphate adenylyltransferase [Salinibacter ruber]MCS3652142.1 glucose-1-phosphate adenylyltransferase [Salinibacter ruber]